MGKFADKYPGQKGAIFNFDDVLLRSARSPVQPKEVDLSSTFAVTTQGEIPFVIPFISSPMSTVTRGLMPTAMARLGCVGVIDQDLPVETAIETLEAVKEASQFVIKNPMTIRKELTMGAAIEIMRDRKISGLPVVEDKKLVGIVTWRDRWFNPPETSIKDAMRTDVVTAQEGVTQEEALRIFHQHPVKKLPVVNKRGNLVGLVTLKDIKQNGQYTHATRDREGKLVVGAAVAPQGLERAKKLAPYADVLLVDAAHFHSSKVISDAREIIRATGQRVIVGNLGTSVGVKESVDELRGVLDSATSTEGVAALRMGEGSGSICTTSDVTGLSSPTLYATAQAADALIEKGLVIPVIADGGIKTGRDVALAFAFGATSVMLGRLLAGCEESPAKVIFERGDRKIKMYYGMGSKQAQEERGALTEPGRYPDPGGKGIYEGRESRLLYRGRVDEVVKKLASATRVGMVSAGAANIVDMHRIAEVALVPESMRNRDRVGLDEVEPSDNI